MRQVQETEIHKAQSTLGFIYRCVTKWYTGAILEGSKNTKETPGRSNYLRGAECFDLHLRFSRIFYLHILYSSHLIISTREISPILEEAETRSCLGLRVGLEAGSV